MIRALTDEEAQVIARTENEFRKTLKDLDRARAMDQLREAGKTTSRTASLFRLSDRQVQRIEGLLDYPEELQAVLNDESSASRPPALIIPDSVKAKALELPEPGKPGEQPAQ